MGGKRPDQHNIDPGEAGSTDYKFREEDPGIREQDRQLYETNRAEAAEGLIPKGGENPALRELRERKAESEKAKQKELDAALGESDDAATSA